METEGTMICLGAILIAVGIGIFKMAPGEDEEMLVRIVGAILALIGAIMVSKGF